MEGFGLCYLKTEGAHIHPDDHNHGISLKCSDDEYIKQMIGYIKDNELDATFLQISFCSRPYLIDKIKQGLM